MICKKHNAPPPRGEIGPRVMYLSKLLRQSFNEAVAEQGLFSGQQDIIFLLNDCEGMTVGEIAKKLKSSAATVSVSVKRMEKAGFITKKADEADARIIRLYPTEKAKSAPENIKNRMDALESVLHKNMNDEEAVLLSDLLEKAIGNMTNRGEDNV